MQSIYLAGGCFWCTEAIFNQVKGINKIIPGYIGGKTPNPTYNMICNGNTGHAEAIECNFDEKVISLDDILEIFFSTHDPTQLNGQGNDIGTQYRSAIFCSTKLQKNKVDKFINSIQSNYVKKIVTEVKYGETFFKAEEYHFDYFKKNSNAPYCEIVIKPKLEKLKLIHGNKCNKF
jgi:peptide-methionine (S)-S-oxide reductase